MRLVRLGIVLALLAGVLPMPTAFGTPSTPVIVVLDEATDPAGVAQAHARSHGATIYHVYRWALRGYAAIVPESRIPLLEADPRVAFIASDRLLSITGQTDPDDAQVVPSGVARIGIDSSGGTGAGIHVAILDTGIDIDHPDLGDNIAGGTDCTGAGTFADDHGHGTHVAGTVAARDNGIGVTGVAPAAKLWAVRVMGSNGQGSASWAICGLDFVASRSPANGGPIRVANLSMAGPGSDGGSCGAATGDPFHRAVCGVVANGVTLVVSAGNSATDLGRFVPASYPEVIAVSALADSDGRPCGAGPSTSSGPDDAFASFSNFAVSASDGARLVAAPGVDILSAQAGGGHATQSGTSMAAPHVAGLAALYLERHPSATPPWVLQALRLAGEREGANFKGECLWTTSHRNPSGRHPEPVVRADDLAAVPSMDLASVGSCTADRTRPGASPLPRATESADGRYEAFASEQDDLVPGDTNGVADVFVHDRDTGATERVSVASDGTQAGGPSSGASISGDGRYVAFTSQAFDLVPGDTNGVADVFVHDRQTGATERVSVASDGTQAGGPSSGASISGDGRYVTFTSQASNLGGSAGTVFARDRGPEVGVGEVIARQGGQHVYACGWATISGASLASATAPAGDVPPGAREQGADLTGASITYRPEQRDLRVRLDLAELPSFRVVGTEPSGAPGIVYGLAFGVGQERYEARAQRVGATGVPPRTPLFAVYRCDGAVCAEGAELSGGLGTTGSSVVLSIPLGHIGATEGSTLTGLRAFVAAGEAATPGVVLDEIGLPDVAIPTRRLETGVSDTGQGAEVDYVPAAWLDGGLFLSAMDGLHERVWARACRGDVCGSKSARPDAPGSIQTPENPQNPGGAGGPALPDVGVVRHGGADRFATAALLSAASFQPGVEAVYVATGLDFPDALAGAVAAALDDAPVLLVTPDRIPDPTAAELARLAPARIVILGGSAVIGDSVERALANYTAGPVQRLRGGDRFATAAAVSQSAFPAGADVVYVATGGNFPDALTGIPAAAAAGGPMLLVATDTIPAATAAELTRLDPDRIVILGGTAVVGDGVAQALGRHAATVERLHGRDRFATAGAVAAAAFPDPAGTHTVFVATGGTFPDALAAGAVAGALPGPVLLTTPDRLPDTTAAELERLTPRRIVIMGGAAAVGADVEARLAAFTRD